MGKITRKPAVSPAYGVNFRRPVSGASVQSPVDHYKICENLCNLRIALCASHSGRDRSITVYHLPLTHTRPSRSVHRPVGHANQRFALPAWHPPRRPARAAPNLCNLRIALRQAGMPALQARRRTRPSRARHMARALKDRSSTTPRHGAKGILGRALAWPPPPRRARAARRP
jgi:hypothetical protein